MSSWSSAITGATRPGHLSTKSNHRKGVKGKHELRTKRQRNLVGGPSARGRGDQVCKVILAYSPERSQMPGASERTPNPIVRMRRMVTPEGRAKLRPRDEDLTVAMLQRCCQRYQQYLAGRILQCQHREECLQLWDLLAGMIPLRKISSPDPLRGKVQPGDWMPQLRKKVIQDARRN